MTSVPGFVRVWPLLSVCGAAAVEVVEQSHGEADSEEAVDESNDVDQGKQTAAGDDVIPVETSAVFCKHERKRDAVAVTFFRR